MTSLAQNFFLALRRAVWRISRPRSARDAKRNRQPQDPGSQTEPGTPFAEGEERRGPSTSQPNHLTGSEMGRENWVAPVGMTGEGWHTHPGMQPRKEKRGTSTAQPNHLTGSEMGR